MSHLPCLVSPAEELRSQLRAISALLTPARCSFRTLSAWSAAVMGGQFLTVLPRVGQPGAHPLPQNVPFELCEHSP